MGLLNGDKPYDRGDSDGSELTTHYMVQPIDRLCGRCKPMISW